MNINGRPPLELTLKRSKEVVVRRLRGETLASIAKHYGMTVSGAQHLWVRGASDADKAAFREFLRNRIRS